jgi:hypothetical protein
MNSSALMQSISHSTNCLGKQASSFAYENSCTLVATYLLPFGNTELQLVDLDCLMLGCMVFAMSPSLDSIVENFLHVLVLLKSSKNNILSFKNPHSSDYEGSHFSDLALLLEEHNAPIFR